MSRLVAQMAQVASAVVFCTLWRLAPFRPPNIEPVLATAMPFGKKYGAVTATVFAVLAMVAYDAITSGVTQWTIVTAGAYALVVAGSGFFFKIVRGIPGYVAYAVVATLVYDFLTGIAAGALLFGMGWKTGLVGQIPFTINHLIGNVILAVALSPIIDYLIERQRKTAQERVIATL